MPYKRDPWGIKEKERSKRRLEYFRNRQRLLSKNKNRASIGFIGEIEAKDIFKTGKLPNNAGADFNYKNKLIDVKTALPTKNGNKFHWKFLLYKQKGKIDYFLIICKDFDKRTKYMFMIPDKDLKLNNLHISEKNIIKYLKYEICKKKEMIFNG